MASTTAAFLGVDVGTQGVRVAAVGADGELLADRRQPFRFADPVAATREQAPEIWWDALVPLLRAAGADVRPRRLVAISVTSTSGTVIPLADDHTPLHPALMYGDARSVAEAAKCRKAAERDAIEAATAPAFATSYGLPKIVWYARTFPERATRVRSWAHAADFVLGRLSGVWGTTDPTNALKTGYDPVAGCWPAYIRDRLGVPDAWLPTVVPTGQVLGRVRPEVAAETGLPPSLLVTTGMTDGCASQVAAGAVRPGEWSTTIGTTLVVKGVTEAPIIDPLGRVYSHLHPEGWWMPGGASNTGAEWIARDFPGVALRGLETSAGALTPTPWTSYPLRRDGERFPFVCPQARGFEPPGLDAAARFAAGMEGVAYLERLAYATLERLAGERIARVSTAGGGSKNLAWLGIRSNVLRRPVVRMRHPDGAVGAAIVAASRTGFDSLSAAAAAMTQVDRIVEPGRPNDYEAGYDRFLAALRQRGYLTESGTLVGA